METAFLTSLLPGIEFVSPLNSRQYRLLPIHPQAFIQVETDTKTTKLAPQTMNFFDSKSCCFQ